MDEWDIYNIQYRPFMFVSSRLVYIVAMNDTWKRKRVTERMKYMYIGIYRMDDKMRGTENKTNWKGDGLNRVDRGIRSGRFFCWNHLLQNILNCYIVLISVAISLLWFFIVVLIVVLRKLTMQSTKIKALHIKIQWNFFAQHIFSISFYFSSLHKMKKTFSSLHKMK